MKLDDFQLTRQDDWHSLEQLVAVANRDVRKLSSEQIKLLGALYRAATSDLALARRDFPRHPVTAYLNQLVAQAHAVIYQEEPFAMTGIRHYVTDTLPRTFRDTIRFTIMAALLFCLPALLSGFLAYLNPETSRWILPEAVQSLIPMIEQKQLWVNLPVEERPYFSTAIMTNNIQVSFVAFAGGMLAGLLTVYTMILNGLLLGGLTGLTAHHGIGFELWTFVIGHGVIELSVIFIAGGAGLNIGWAIIHPGLLSRGDAIRQAAGKSVRLLIACVPLLVIAGLIEGFISPAETIHWTIKWAIGGITGAILYAYLLLAGREKSETWLK